MELTKVHEYGALDIFSTWLLRYVCPPAVPVDTFLTHYKAILLPFTKAINSAEDSDETIGTGDDEDEDDEDEPTDIAEMAREESDDRIINDIDNEVREDYLLSAESSRVGQTAVTKVSKCTQLLTAYCLRQLFLYSYVNLQSGYVTHHFLLLIYRSVVSQADVKPIECSVLFALGGTQWPRLLNKLCQCV